MLPTTVIKISKTRTLLPKRQTVIGECWGIFVMLFLEKANVYFIETISFSIEKIFLLTKKDFSYILKKLVYEKVWDFIVVSRYLGSVF